MSMAMDFSDEEWDISDDQWDTLETNAILSTQQKKILATKQSARPATKNGHTNSRHGATNLLRQATTAQIPQNAYAHLTSTDSFDNPQLDEDGVPLVVEEQPRAFVAIRPLDDAAQREQWRLSRFAQKHGPQEAWSIRQQSVTVPRKAFQEYQQKRSVAQSDKPAQHYVPPPLPLPLPLPLPESTLNNPPSQATQGFEIIQPPIQNDPVEDELSRLRREKEELVKSVTSIQNELYTARGEISVIRSKTTNELKAAGRKFDVLRKQMQDEASKHLVLLKSKDTALGELSTESNFLKHELNEQSRKLESLQRQAKLRPLQEKAHDLNHSPRKNIANSLRDGFDDDEIMLMSPTRSPARRVNSKPNTPSKKRKLPATTGINSEALPLRFSGDPTLVANSKTAPKPDAPLSVKVVPDYQTTQHLRFIQAVFAFCPLQKHVSLIESLATFAFPSDPVRSLSSSLLASSSHLQGHKLPAQFLKILSALLTRCLKEEYHKPLPVLLGTVLHVLDLDPAIVDEDVVHMICNPVQDLALVNARIRWTGDERNPKRQIPKPDLKPDINSAACLEILLVTASLIVDEPTLLGLFWEKIGQELTLLLLSPVQPIADLTLMVELMHTSIRPTSFGNIMTAELQRANEGHIIDKICHLLYDPPRSIIRFGREKKALPLTSPKSTEVNPAIAPSPSSPPSRFAICEFRLKVVDLLSKIAFSCSPHPHQANIATNHGLSIILAHPNPVARLTRLIHDEVVNLYASHIGTHTLHAEIVNRSVRLLHHLLLSPQAMGKSSNFDLVRSLSAVTGGVHRFRVALTRVHFREGFDTVGLDCGIDEDTTHLAKEILEEYMTPDEAFQMLRAFGRDEVDEEMRDDDGHDDEDRDGQEAEAEAEAEAAVMAGVVQ